MKQSGDKVSAVAPTSDSQSVAQSEQHSGSRQQMTPDELREMAGLANLDLDASWGNRMCVFADAWEAERAHAAADVCMWRDCEERNADLRERLEAAEKVMRDAARGLRDYETSDDELDEIANRLAALAGEEKDHE